MLLKRKTSKICKKSFFACMVTVFFSTIITAVHFFLQYMCRNILFMRLHKKIKNKNKKVVAYLEEKHNFKFVTVWTFFLVM